MLIPYRGRPPIEYSIEAASRWKPLVVAGTRVAECLCRRSDIELIVNEQPDRGMVHSLALANAAIANDASLMVLLADKPLVTPELIETLLAASQDSDVVFPRHPRTQAPGHPVLFSPRARAKIPLLADGDSIRTLRDDPQLVRREVAAEDPGAYFDIDTADALCE